MIGRWFAGSSLRAKLLASTVGILLLTAVTTLMVIGPVVRNRFREEIVKRGRSVAESVARESVAPVLAEDYLSLQLLIRETLRLEKDLAYVYVHDRDGAVLAHTFENGFPLGLDRVGPPLAREEVVQISTERGVIEDVAVPVMEGALGFVHVGLTEEPIGRALAELGSSLAPLYLLILLAGIGGAVAVSVVVTRPLERLVVAAASVGQGDLNARVPEGGSGEVGRLSRAFNRMVDELAADVAQRKETEGKLLEASQELEARNRQLMKLDRMKDGLVRDVSHELKTPVAKMSMQIEMLRLGLERGEDTAGVERSLAAMQAILGRQEQVIRSILDLSRLEGGGRVFERKPVRLDQVVTSVLEEYRPLVEADGGEASADIGEVTLTSDPEMLWHVFSNLVSNAIKYRGRERPLRLRVSGGVREGSAVVRLEDNGIGMTREELARAFDRFYQSSPSSEGAGVGLSICRMIVRGLGGTIRMESAGRGAGCAAVVTLPLDPPPSPAPRAPAAA